MESEIAVLVLWMPLIVYCIYVLVREWVNRDK